MSPGLWQLLFVAIFGAVFVVPMWRILSRMGFAGAWSLVIFIPIGGVILLWVIAFVEWPATKRSEQATTL